MNNQQEFLGKITNAISNTWLEHGILPSLVLAQAILESGWGTSILAKKANNLFGVKANNNWDGPYMEHVTMEYKNGRRMSIKDNFRKYGSWNESIIDHALFLKDQRRYQTVIGVKEYEVACKAVQQAGYATDPAYAAKLIDIIIKNNLDNYDVLAFAKEQSNSLRYRIYTEVFTTEDQAATVAAILKTQFGWIAHRFKSGHVWQVKTGTFTTTADAIQAQKKIKTLGYNAQIKPEG